MTDRVAVVTGIRTPFCKAGGAFKDLQADDLGAFAVRELLAISHIDPDLIDELVFGNVLQPPHAANIARVLAMKGGLPMHTPAFTVNRNCASGLEAIVSAANRIRLGEADVIIAGGTESMSNFPILFRSEMREFLMRLSKAKSFKQKISALLSFRPYFLYPDIPKIADPICGLTMGQTAEVLAREFHVTRDEQDEYALLSQHRAEKALKSGRFADEIIPIPTAPGFEFIQQTDDGIREGQTLQDLEKLKPVFDKVAGTVTAGNSSQVTDGAAALLLMRESLVKKHGLTPLGYIKAYSDAALDPKRMGLGPVFATSKVLDKARMKLDDFDLIEINEAFAAQVLAVKKACHSDAFSKRYLNKDKALGDIKSEKLNVNGGAISLGHPIGVSGARITLTLLKELNRQGKNTGLATLCVGGGQGQALIVEVG